MLNCKNCQNNFISTNSKLSTELKKNDKQSNRRILLLACM